MSHLSGISVAGKLRNLDTYMNGDLGGCQRRRPEVAYTQRYRDRMINLTASEWSIDEFTSPRLSKNMGQSVLEIDLMVQQILRSTRKCPHFGLIPRLPPRYHRNGSVQKIYPDLFSTRASAARRGFVPDKIGSTHGEIAACFRVVEPV